MKLSLLTFPGRWTAADGFSLLGPLCIMTMLLLILYWAGVWDGPHDSTQQANQRNDPRQTEFWTGALQLPDQTTAAYHGAVMDEMGSF